MTSTRPLMALVAVMFFATAAVAWVWFFTCKPIAEAEQFSQAQWLSEILSQTTYDNNPMADSILLSASEARALGRAEGAKLYVALWRGTPQVVVVPVTQPKGYGGAIELWVGLAMDGSVVGVRASRHRETPGLGGHIDITSSPWILSFNGKSLTLPTLAWRSRKNGGKFDQIAGATITSNGVITAVRSAQLFFADNKTLLLRRFMPPATTTNRDYPR